MKMRVSSSRAGVYTAVLVVVPILALFLGTRRSEADTARKSTANKQAAVRSSAARSSSGQSKAKALEAYGNLPLAFERNMGQTDARVSYLTRGSGYELFLAPQEAVLTLWQPPSVPSHLSPNLTRTPESLHREAAVLRLQMSGASSSPEIEGTNELERKANYFIGNDPKDWVTNVPSYGRVEYKGIYPGVDLAFYGNQRRLEYDFVVSSGTDPRTIALRLEGSKKNRIDSRGNLVVSISSGEVSFRKPLMYQTDANGERQEIAGGYKLAKNGAVEFAVSEYDRTRPLVIDPVLDYSTYLGGSPSPGDTGYSVAVDGNGNAFVTGETYNASFPLTTIPATTVGLGTPDASIASNGGAFVSEIDPTGTKELYFSYLSGDGGEIAYSVAVDPAGNTTCMNGVNPGFCVYVTGETFSDNFPVSSVVTPYNSTMPTGGAPTVGNAFITKFNPYVSGATSLLYSSYLASTNAGDLGHGIAVDSSQDAYITGLALASPGAVPNFPILNGAQTAAPQAAGNAFLTVLNTTASSNALLYSTYLEGDDANAGSSTLGLGDIGWAVAVDSSKIAYIVGTTPSSNFPNTSSSGTFPNIKGWLTAAPNTQGTAFVAAVKTTLTGVNSLVYSTYVGGSSSEVGNGIALGGNGTVFITGQTTSSNFSTTESGSTAGQFPSPANAAGMVFVTKLNTSANGAPPYSVLLGGTAGDTGNSIQVDGLGNVIVVGTSQSPNFPLTPGAFKTALSGSMVGDVFVSKLNPGGNGSADLLYSSYFGGSGTSTVPDQGYGVALDSLNNVYVTGQTYSADFPVSAGAFQTSLPGGDLSAAFVSKLTLIPTVGFAVGSTPCGSTAAALPCPVAFGNQLISTPSASQAVILTNNTSAAVPVTLPVTVSGTNSADFVATPAASGPTPACTASLAAGASCAIGVVFTPTTSSGESASLSVTYTAGFSTNPAATEAFNLTGTGVSPTVTLNPTTTLNFSTPQQVSTTSGALPVTVNNTGSGNLVFSAAPAISGANASDFAIASGTTCTNGGTVTPTTSCTINITFTPGASGSRMATLTIADNASGSPQSISITGTGTTAPMTSVSPLTVPFGNQLVTTTSTAQTVTVQNTGTVNLNITAAPSISGTNASDFAIASGTTCTNGASLTPNSTCVINVTFTPPANGTGSRAAILNIADNAAGSPQMVNLTGTGIAPAATVAPLTVPFGNQLVTTTSAAQTVTVQNTGTANLNITAAPSFSGANASDFAIASGTTCTNGASVTPNSTCVINVTFTPPANGTGSRSGILNITDNASGSPQMVNLTGTGIAPAANVSPSPVPFGNQQVTTTSAAQTVTVKNTGTANLNITAAASLSGANASDFAIASGTTCTNGASLTPNNTCVINITFTPGASGSRTAALAISDNASGSPQMVNLTGTGTAPAATVSPLTVPFGNQLVTTTSAAQAVTVQNTGTANLTITAAPSISGTNASDFAIASGTTCTNGASVTPNSTCVINITFTPPANGTGSRSATLNITDNAAGSPQTVSLTGTGTTAPPAASVSPSTLTFTGQLVTTTSTAQTVTVKNTGGSNLTISAAPSFSGANASDFAVAASGTTCTSGAMVAAGSTCVINVTFTPPAGASGSRAAALSVADNATGSPQAVTLAATAWDFTISAQAPATVTPGSTATIAVTVTGLGGFTGGVTLSCSATVPQGSCTGPANAVTAPGTGNVTLATQSFVTPPASTRRPPISMQQVALAAFALTLLFALPVARRFRTRLGLAGAAALLIVVAGCAGNLQTPAGTYPVTITGTSGGVTHAVTVNVVVN